MIKIKVWFNQQVINNRRLKETGTFVQNFMFWFATLCILWPESVARNSSCNYYAHAQFMQRKLIMKVYKK